jgi:hypothetical protein
MKADTDLLRIGNSARGNGSREFFGWVGEASGLAIDYALRVRGKATAFVKVQAA